MNSAHLLALLMLFVTWVDSFSWDIIVSQGNQLKFYDNREIVHTEYIPSANNIYSLTYDPVLYRVLFADDQFPNHEISSFDLSTRNVLPLVTRTSSYYLSITYDPVTQLLFWKDGFGIYSFSLDPASSTYNYAVRILTLDHYCRDIALDSCGGYIYWITDKEIERAQFDGSQREVLKYSTVNYRFRVAIDQQTQKIYWTEKIYWSDQEVSIECADLNGMISRTYTIKREIGAGALTVSNDFIYWHGRNQKAIWHLPKNLPQQSGPKLFARSSSDYWEHNVIAANYTIKDLLKENQKCENLKRLIPKKSELDCVDVMLCVHGTKVSEESRCECTNGYTGERCDVYGCQNYCLQGNCSVSADGQPKCSCIAGYSGQRCEVNACHGYCLNAGVCYINEEDIPVCQCTKDYEGDRCGIPICKNYCLEGNCSVSAEGQPICSCNAGYSGQRCEVNACHGYCLNAGVCSLNEEDSPVCQCTIDYEGERCGIPICKDYCFAGNCNVSDYGQPICSCADGYSGERCEFNACQDYCFNNGVCFLNEEEEAVCQCAADYEGERCDIAIKHTIVDGDNMAQIQRELRSKVKQVVNENQ